VSGHIDLSAGSAVGLVAVVAAWVQVDAGLGAEAAILAALAVGLLMGAWQGLWIAYGHVPSFVVTLGGLLLFRGLALVITEGRTLSPLEPGFVVFGQGFLGAVPAIVIMALVYVVVLALISRSRRARARLDLPAASRRSSVGVAGVTLVLFVAVGLGASLYLGVPYPVVIMAVVITLLAIMMRQSTFGRRLYAIGGNPDAALLSGIDIRRNTFLVFVLMGLLYSVVGILLSARLNAGPPNAGIFMELDAIAAAVIGGASLLGGIGTVQGALLGAVLMASIANGMSLMNILTWWQQIVTGLLLMTAVLIDVNSKRRSP
jgi:D-xylose transport system permease protein